MMYQLNTDINTEEYTDGRTRIWGKCKVNRKVYECWVPTEGLNAWRNGMKIQLAMPTVSASDREFLKSGISPEAWDDLFGDPA